MNNYKPWKDYTSTGKLPNQKQNEYRKLLAIEKRARSDDPKVSGTAMAEIFGHNMERYGKMTESEKENHNIKRSDEIDRQLGEGRHYIAHGGREDESKSITLRSNFHSMFNDKKHRHSIKPQKRTD